MAVCASLAQVKQIRTTSSWYEAISKISIRLQLRIVSKTPSFLLLVRKKEALYARMDCARVNQVEADKDLGLLNMNDNWNINHLSSQYMCSMSPIRTAY